MDFMSRVEINKKTFELKMATMNNELFRDSKRKVCTLTISNTSYEEIATYFIDGASWKIIDAEEHEYDWSDFNLSGQIVDLRDGTFTVKMAEKFTEAEILKEDVISLKQNLKMVSGVEDGTVEEFTVLRKNIETLYTKANITNDDRIAYRSFCPVWEKGNHKEEEVYCTILGVNTDNPENEQVWICFQNYDNDTYPDIAPDNPAWRTFNKPLHGITPETAMPWVKPTNATDQYNTGEYMIYTNGTLYKCLQDTSFSPEEYPEAWETKE